MNKFIASIKLDAYRIAERMERNGMQHNMFEGDGMLSLGEAAFEMLSQAITRDPEYVGRGYPRDCNTYLAAAHTILRKEGHI